MKTPLLLVCLALFLSSCKVGPNYVPPDTPVPEYFRESDEGPTDDLEDSALFHWWLAFEDPLLDALLEQALEGNFDFQISLNKIVAARAIYWSQFTQLLPDFLFGAQASRSRASQSFANSQNNLVMPTANGLSTTTPLSPIRNFFQLGFDAVWELDFFGGLQRATEAAYDNWQASIYDARGIKITMLSEIANTYVSIRALQQKKDIAKQSIEIEAHLIKLSEARFDAGLSNSLEVNTFRAALKTDEALYVAADESLKTTIYSLAVLVGQFPESLIDTFQPLRPIPKGFGKVPAGLPADLLRRRPDIRSAERALAAATANIGVAVAQLFPTVSLIGSSTSFASNPLQGANIGWSSDQLNKLFKPASRIWGYGAFVSFPIFDFGRREAGVVVEESLQQQAYLTYQKTVITAFQEVEQNLTAYFHEELRFKELDEAAAINTKNVKLATDLFAAGLASYDQVVIAIQAWLTSMNSKIDAEQALTASLIALYKSMGGEW